MKLLNQCVDLYGPLSRNNTALLTALFSQPTEELWRRTQRIVISDRPLLTLRCAVNGVTNGKASRHWMPDEFTLHRALRYAIKRRNDFIADPQVPFSES
jgi:hypothetical protein